MSRLIDNKQAKKNALNRMRYKKHETLRDKKPLIYSDDKITH